MSKFEKLKTFEPLPKSVTIKKSTIHGIGLFSTEKISSNTELGITHIKDERFSHGYIRTPLGGFFNHSKQPNCEAIYDGDYIKLVTINDVNFDEELTIDYTKHDWIKEKNE